MKQSAFAYVLFAITQFFTGVAFAQGLTSKDLIALGLPKCVAETPCVFNISGTKCTSVSQFACLCASQFYLDRLSACMCKVCKDPKDQMKAVDLTIKICQQGFKIPVKTTNPCSKPTHKAIKREAAVAAPPVLGLPVPVPVPPFASENFGNRSVLTVPTGVNVVATPGTSNIPVVTQSVTITEYQSSETSSQSSPSSQPLQVSGTAKAPEASLAEPTSVWNYTVTSSAIEVRTVTAYNATVTAIGNLTSAAAPESASNVSNSLKYLYGALMVALLLA